MNEDIELRHLRYFLAVADTLHFTKAAKQLGIAQPPLSQQIKKLEKLLGHPLFVRSTRGVRLTPAGTMLATRARDTLNKINDDLAQVRRLGRGEEGTVTVGFSGSVMFTNLPKAIQAYRRRYPKVELRLREMVTAAQVAALLDRTIDLAFMRDGDPTEGIEIGTLLKERFIAVLPESHPLAAKRSLRMQDLSHERFVLFGRHHGLLAYDRTIEACKHSGFTPNIVQEAPQFPTVIRLVAAGVGVSLMPACLANLAIPGSVYRNVQSPVRTTVDSGFRRGSTCTMTANFLRIAREQLAK
jgi:DNA-binding transcriptional LysR family regulator